MCGTAWRKSGMKSMTDLETTLSELRRELAEHGDRVFMFVPYIPLMIYDATGAKQICSFKSEEEIDAINASPERTIKLSDMIRTLNGLVRVLNDVQSNGDNLLT